MDELWLYNSKAQKRICKCEYFQDTYEQMLIRAGITIADVMVDHEGVEFTMDDLCIEMVHADFF